MQFAFAYYNYLMFKFDEFNLETVWQQEYDTNNDGILDDNELRTLAAHIINSTLKNSHLTMVKDVCFNYPHKKTEFLDIPKDYTNNSIYPPFTYKVLKDCNEIVEMIKKHVKSRKVKNNYEIANLRDVAFNMITSNLTQTFLDLDNIRRNKPKFICLNDDMIFNNEKVIDARHYFYQSLLPLPSSFELTTGRLYRNLNIYTSTKNNCDPKQWNSIFLFIAAIIIMYGTVYIVKRKYFSCQNINNYDN